MAASTALRTAASRLLLAPSTRAPSAAAARASNFHTTASPASSSSSSSSSSTGLTEIQDSHPRNLPAEQAERNTHPTPADITSDAPPALHNRPVRIYKPAKTSNSSGKAGTAFWKVDFDILQGSARWENPLMGWASSGDYMQGVGMQFRSREDAVHFCEKQGWPYFVAEPNKARIPPKSYASNYDYISANKVRIHHTK
ncbi:hypothetical protein A4X03_0g6273 [Tilletia caries]|uniref:NADH dehydrogenase [ubiquinone] iron-sulfur protein 4, mitochondrial n=1 Tax=Tilletia caries TaxID=13290 RepID=A0A8T8SZP1_9BASI|nr:hypothetical protein A4X03_0g6273 [Tilletia caries]